MHMTDIRHEESLVDYARKEIQSRIQNGIYQPGSKLTALEIASSLGISRTPVVTAINQLVAQGFAEKVSPRTTVVTPLNLPQVREIIQVREMIELYSADLIIRNLPFCTEIAAELDRIVEQMFETFDEENYARSGDLETQFHTTFISLTRNSRIIKQYESNWSIGIVFVMFARSQTPLYKRLDSIRQHKKMLDFAKAGDAEGLRGAIREHLKIVNDTLDWLIENGGNNIFTF